MVSQNVLVMNQSGIHARPAAQFVKAASAFKANISVSNNGKSGTAKSLISILGLCICKGNEITITAEGADEQEAAPAISGSFKNCKWQLKTAARSAPMSIRV